MAFEIEHKYLVINNLYKSLFFDKIEIRQGYLSRDPNRVVRVRIFGQKGYITIKGITTGDTRLEYEYEVPVEDAKEIIKLALPPIIEKTRYKVDYEGDIWEIDEFHGDLAPLVIAEIELQCSEQNYELPPFVGKNVTGVKDYYNSELAKNGLPKN